MSLPYLRSVALLGLGALGLSMLVPAEDGPSVGAHQAPRSRLAASSELTEYLDARLRPVSLQQIEGTEVTSPSDLTGSSTRTVEDVPTASAVVTALAVDEFSSQSSTPLNVRAGPGSGTAKLFVLRPGTPVRIDQTSGNWARITLSDETTGWAYALYLTEEKPPLSTDGGEMGVGIGGAEAPFESIAVARPLPIAAPADERRLAPPDNAPMGAATKVKAFRLANDTVMRSAPSRSAQKLSVIAGGSRLQVAEWDGSWARVVLPSGASGWINVR